MRLVLAFLLAMFASVVSAAATERILKFESDITVKVDGTLHVIETITVKAENRKINRGIYRDFPIRYNEDGYWRYVGFKLLKVERDGHAEPWFDMASGDFKRIYIGSKSVFLKPGIYTYRLTYETNRQLRYFDDFDELYWNVTGNNWAFPIDKAIAKITLPPKAKIQQQQAYTGSYRSTRNDANVIQQLDNEIYYEASNLQRREGLTIAVGWQKGVVSQPGLLQHWFWRLWDNLGLALLMAGTFAVGYYFIHIWNRIGRDPQAGVIIPLFTPPKGLSPAAVSYIHFQKFRSAGKGATVPFIAALVSLATKGAVKIDDTHTNLTLSKRTENPQLEFAGEKVLFNTLLGSRKSIEFKQSNHTTVQLARNLFRNEIGREHASVYFRNNYLYFAAGAVVSLLIVAGFFLLQQPPEDTFLILLWAFIFALAGSFLLSMGLRRLWDWIPGGGSKITGVVFTVLGIIVLFPAVTMSLVVDNTPLWVPVALSAIAVMNVSFFHLLRAPTEMGRKTMDEIEGFKLYLSVAEAERMNMDNAPDVTQEIFEKYLPYAIALGVEKPWSKAFEKFLEKTAGATGNTSYSPGWYQGPSHWNSGSLAGATAGVISGVSAGMAQASPPSSSGSSSSGGGGFSGGGGGGGGGGGW